jgi:hypothetical protein
MSAYAQDTHIATCQTVVSFLGSAVQLDGHKNVMNVSEIILL